MRETIVDRAYAKTLLPPRKEDGHKGDFGKLLVLGGSVGYTGAPYLAASAAVHSGCGLVYLGVPESIWAVEAQKCVSAMPFPLPETDGRLCLAALDKMQDKLKGCDVLALGPGLGRGKETEHERRLLTACRHCRSRKRTKLCPPRSSGNRKISDYHQHDSKRPLQ